MVSLLLKGLLAAGLCLIALACRNNESSETSAPPSATDAVEETTTVPDNTEEVLALEVEPLPPLRTDVRVTNLSFGSEVDNYNNPIKRLKDFAANESVYAVVITDGSGPEAQIQVIVTDANNASVYDQTQSLVPNGSWASAFNLREKSEFVAGEYRAKVLLDGHPVAENSFRIRP